MGKRYPQLQADQIEFIHAQKVFFVATAGAEGSVNLSPKGLDSLRVIDPQRVLWLNLTGSGNETAAHVLENGRMTLMFCAFTGDPLILRIYGQTRMVQPSDADWAELYDQLPPQSGARQIFDLQVERVQTSCGYGVPLMDFKEERTILPRWAEKKGKEGIRAYQEKNNKRSIDGKTTGLG